MDLVYPSIQQMGADTKPIRLFHFEKVKVLYPMATKMSRRIMPVYAEKNTPEHSGVFRAYYLSQMIKIRNYLIGYNVIYIYIRFQYKYCPHKFGVSLQSFPIF